MENITGLSIYVNGTNVSGVVPLQIKLKSGDFIQVNFIMPCTEYSSINQITVFSNDAMYCVVLPSSIKPQLVTDLGWYLHNSSDQISNMTNKFTIYGAINNDGATDAQNCSLIIKFYNNETLLQTSNVPIGEIRRFGGGSYYLNQNIPCNVADSVTRTEVYLRGDNIPQREV